MELFSVVFYHPEKGFLWGVNQEGKYDCMTGVWSDEYDPIVLINTLLNAEMMLYECFYLQKRFDYEGVSYDLEMMRRKYVDLEEEMYQQEIYMDGVMGYHIWEWFHTSHHTLDVGNHRYLFLDISLLKDKRDEEMLMNLGDYCEYMNKKMNLKKEMKSWEWKKLSEIRPWKSSDVVCEIRSELNYGLC
jgi:hypothetical protein